jgi:hypothetical protein
MKVEEAALLPLWTLALVGSSARFVVEEEV